MYQYPQPPQYPQPVYYPQQQYSGCLKVLLYILSFLIPIVGIVIAIIFMSRPDPESKSLGNACLIVSIISIVVWCCVGTIIVLSGGALPFLFAGQ